MFKVIAVLLLSCSALASEKVMFVYHAPYNGIPATLTPMRTTDFSITIEVGKPEDHEVLRCKPEVRRTRIKVDGRDATSSEIVLLCEHGITAVIGGIQF